MKNQKSRIDSQNRKPGIGYKTSEEQNRGNREHKEDISNFQHQIGQQVSLNEITAFSNNFRSKVGEMILSKSAIEVAIENFIDSDDGARTIKEKWCVTRQFFKLSCSIE